MEKIAVNQKVVFGFVASRRWRGAILLASTLLAVFNCRFFLAFAGEQAVGLRPVSSGLPPGVVRLRSPLNFSRGNFGFTKNGEKQNTGFEAERLSQNFVIDANVFDNLTVYAQVPYVHKDTVGLDASVFRKSTFYETQYGVLAERLAGELSAQGICQTQANCLALIENGYALPADKTTEIEGDEVLNIKAGVPLRDYIDSVVVNAVRPEPGNTGFGDPEAGFLYSVIDLKSAAHQGANFGLGFGGYLRFPTSDNEDVPRSKRALGSGSTDLALRVGLDYLIEKHALISVLFTGESQLRPGRRQRSLKSDGRQLSGRESQNLRRIGLRQNAFLKVEYNLAGISEALLPLSGELRFKYTLEPEVRLGDERQTEAVSAQSALFGLRFEQLTENALIPSLVPGISFLPWTVGFLYEYPLLSSGDNVFVAVSTLSVFLELYYRF